MDVSPREGGLLERETSEDLYREFLEGGPYDLKWLITLNLSPVDFFYYMKYASSLQIRRFFSGKDADGRPNPRIHPFRDFFVARSGEGDDDVVKVEMDIKKAVEPKGPINYWQLWMCAYQAIHFPRTTLYFGNQHEFLIQLFRTNNDNLVEGGSQPLDMHADWWIRVYAEGDYEWNRRGPRTKATGSHRYVRQMHSNRLQNIRLLRRNPDIRRMMAAIESILDPDGMVDRDAYPVSRGTTTMEIVYEFRFKTGEFFPTVIPNTLFVSKGIILDKDEDVMDTSSNEIDTLLLNRLWFRFTRALIAYIVLQTDPNAVLAWDTPSNDEQRLFLRSCIQCGNVAQFMSNDTPVCGKECQMEFYKA